MSNLIASVSSYSLSFKAFEHSSSSHKHNELQYLFWKEGQQTEPYLNVIHTYPFHGISFEYGIYSFHFKSACWIKIIWKKIW